MVKGIVFDIRKYSIHDGPGIRTTVFFKGCPLTCHWCHNPESQAIIQEIMVRPNRCIRCGACVEACASGAIAWEDGLIVTNGDRCTLCGACTRACYAEAREIVGAEMSVGQVMAEIERDISFYEESNGGVTFSGGEPLVQREFLRALLRACKEQDIHTALDTCGFATWETLDSVREYVDLFLYDLKLMDDARHRQYTGVSNALILGNLRALAQRGHAIIVRAPVIPGVNDDDEAIRQLGAWAAALPGLRQVDLLPYHHLSADKYARLNRAYRLETTHPPSESRMHEIAQNLRGFGLCVNVGG